MELTREKRYKRRIAQLEAENVALKKEVAELKTQVGKLTEQIAKDDLGEKVHIIAKDIPLPMTVWVDEPDKIGTDRVVSAAAAYAVVEDAVVVGVLVAAGDLEHPLPDQVGVAVLDIAWMAAI